MPKLSKAPTAIDEYLASVPEPARTTLSKVCEAIRSVVPAGTTETITYRMPVWKYQGLLIGVVAYSKHCGLCVMNPSVMELFRDDVDRLHTAEGIIRVPVDRPLPLALVKQPA